MQPVPLNSSLTEQLLALLERPTTDDDRRRAALHLVDWLGCATIGRTSPVGKLLSADFPYATLPDPADGAMIEAAAFALGGLGSLYEMDDLHRTAILHPGPVVLPAALAVGAEGSATDLLDAIVLGYEVMIRIGSSVGPAHYAFFHNTATCGGFGAAAAAGHRLHLDRAAMVSALGIAGSVAGGLWQCRNEPVSSKAMHVADAARRGVAAARMAQRGLTAPRFILEGSQGLFNATARDGNPSSVVAGPDDDWKIWETSFKPWPACRHVHAAIDATLALRDEIGPVLDDIAEVRVETYADAILFCDRVAPATVVQAKFSLQHAIAVVLVRGRPQLADFDLAAVGVEGMESLRQRIRPVATTEFTDVYPAHFGARVIVSLRDGRSVTRTVADAWGDTENPMTDATVVDKARTLLQAAGMEVDAAAALVSAALALAEGGALTDFAAAYARSAPPAKH